MYCGAPHTADARYTRQGGVNDISHLYALWPATVDGAHCVVVISTEELSALDGGEPYGINNEKITRALQRFRALIERRANELLVKNAHEVVLAR